MISILIIIVSYLKIFSIEMNKNLHIFDFNSLLESSFFGELTVWDPTLSAFEYFEFGLYVLMISS